MWWSYWNLHYTCGDAHAQCTWYRCIWCIYIIAIAIPDYKNYACICAVCTCACACMYKMSNVRVRIQECVHVCLLFSLLLVAPLLPARHTYSDKQIVTACMGALQVKTFSHPDLNKINQIQLRAETLLFSSANHPADHALRIIHCILTVSCMQVIPAAIVLHHYNQLI